MATELRRERCNILKKAIVITYVTESQTQQHKWCNTNNHKFAEFPAHIQCYEEKEKSRTEYHAINSRTNYQKFCSMVHIQDHVHNPMQVIHLSKDECEDLFEIAKIATISGKIPRTRSDDFFYILYQVVVREFAAHLFLHQPHNTETCTHAIQEWLQLHPQCEYADIPCEYYETRNRYFIRVEECSPKDSHLGMGPFTNVQRMLESLVYSCRARKALQKASDDFIGGSGTSLYCVPWRDDIQTSHEFRCFINRGNLTAITQYSWCRDYDWIHRQNILIKMCAKIQCLADTVTQQIQYDTYVLDVHVSIVNDGNDDDDASYHVELIECNSFGAQLSAGAGCFHWIRDYEQLYGINGCRDRIEVRIVVNDERTLTAHSALSLIDQLLNVFSV